MKHSLKWRDIAATNSRALFHIWLKPGNESWSPEKRESFTARVRATKIANRRGAGPLLEERGSPSMYSKVQAFRAAYGMSDNMTLFVSVFCFLFSVFFSLPKTCP